MNDVIIIITSYSTLNHNDNVYICHPLLKAPISIAYKLGDLYIVTWLKSLSLSRISLILKEEVLPRLLYVTSQLFAIMSLVSLSILSVILSVHLLPFSQMMRPVHLYLFSLIVLIISLILMCYQVMTMIFLSHNMMLSVIHSIFHGGYTESVHKIAAKIFLKSLKLDCLISKQDCHDWNTFGHRVCSVSKLIWS